MRSEKEWENERCTSKKFSMQASFPSTCQGAQKSFGVNKNLKQTKQVRKMKNQVELNCVAVKDRIWNHYSSWKHGEKPTAFVFPLRIFWPPWSAVTKRLQNFIFHFATEFFYFWGVWCNVGKVFSTFRGASPPWPKVERPSISANHIGRNQEFSLSTLHTKAKVQRLS